MSTASIMASAKRVTGHVRRCWRGMAAGGASWREQTVWLPAPREVVQPSSAGCSPPTEMPRELDRLAAPPVFICGCARSGTTYTFDLFDRHPEVGAICESWILSQVEGVTSVLTQPYWDTSIRQTWESRVKIPFGAIQLLSYAEMVGELGSLLARWLMRGVSEEQRYLAAKEPLDLAAAAILFPEAKFIHVLRDGRDVAVSMKRASESWDPSMGVGVDLRLRAKAWRQQVESLRRHAAALGGRYMEIRYEQIRADPVSAMRKMFGFAGISYTNSLLEQIARSTQLDAYDEAARRSGFRGGSVGRSWRSELGMRDARGFQQAAGDLLFDLGYEHRDLWWLSQTPTLRWRRNPRTPVASRARGRLRAEA